MVGTGNSVKSFINSTSGSYGQFQIGNPTTNDEASMVFISGVTAFGNSPTSTSGNSYMWAIGAGVYGIGGNSFAISNVGYGGPIFKLASTGAATFSSSVTATKLNLSGASGPVGQNAITFSPITGYTNEFYLYNGNTGSAYGWSLYDVTNSAWRFTMSNAGNFLIGTTTDNGDKLQVNGSIGFTNSGNKINTGSANVTTSLTNIGTGTAGIGSMYFLAYYNNSNGSQGVSVLIVRSGSVTVVSENNNTGLTITYSPNANQLRATVSSGSITLGYTQIQI
jgi:hypothetical protein